MSAKKVRVRSYDREFRIGAVKLVLENKRSQREVCEDLGISKSALYKWLTTYQAEAEEGFPGKGHLKSADEEMRRLKREVEILRQERDILKKALGIFSSNRNGSMP
jgi:transposase